MNGFSGPTVGVGAFALGAAFCLAVFGKMLWPKLIVALIVTGVGGVLVGTWGGAIRGAVVKADAAAGHAIGTLTGTAVMGLGAFIVVFMWGLWIYNNQIDKKTLAFSGIVPIAVTLIPGVIGTVATWAVSGVAVVVGGLLSMALAGHWG